MKLQDVLKKQGACNEARVWVKNLSPEEAYATCERGDWLLWMHGALYPDFHTHPDQVRKRVLVAGLAANLVRNKMTDERSIAAVDAAIAFGMGVIGIDELNEAANAACVAADAAAAAASTDDACAAAYAAKSAAYAAKAAKAARAAVYVGDEAKSADIFRAHITLDEMLNQLKQLNQ